MFRLIFRRGCLIFLSSVTLLLFYVPSSVQAPNDDTPCFDPRCLRSAADAPLESRRGVTESDSQSTDFDLRQEKRTMKPVTKAGIEERKRSLHPNVNNLLFGRKRSSARLDLSSYGSGQMRNPLLLGRRRQTLSDFYRNAVLSSRDVKIE